MRTKQISISLLLAVTLGLSGCGGGGGTPEIDTSGTPDQVVRDTTAPVIVNDKDIVTNPTIEEGTANLEIATIEASDENGVTFSLSGTDANYFELVAKSRSTGSKVLKFKSTPDYEEKSVAVYNVSVIIKDSKGNETKKDFTITLEDKPFALDITGNMGAVVQGDQKILNLITNGEEKDRITYEVVGDSQFTISADEKSVVFTAPSYDATPGAKNSYIATLTANDGNSVVTLKLKASVVNAAGDSPVLETYLLKDKTEYVGDFFTTYQYTYDENNTLVKMFVRGTNMLNEYTTFKYSADHKIMKGYTSYSPNTLGSLTSIRVFEDKKTDKHKFAASILQGRLSIDEYVNFIWEPSDSVEYKYNMHLSKYIYGKLINQTTADLYVYNNEDKLVRKIENGNFDVNTVSTLSDSVLKTVNAPAGGYPLATTRLNANQVQSLNSGAMPYVISQETTYIYDANGKLVKGKGFTYGDEPKEGSFDITVSYYGTNIIHTIENQGDSIEYDQESRLSKVGDYTYSYTENGTAMKVEIRNNNKLVATYNFEEE